MLGNKISAAKALTAFIGLLAVTGVSAQPTDSDSIDVEKNSPISNSSDTAPDLQNKSRDSSGYLIEVQGNSTRSLGPDSGASGLAHTARLHTKVAIGAGMAYLVAQLI